MSAQDLVDAAAETGDKITLEEAATIFAAIQDMSEAFDALRHDHGEAAAISAVLTLADEITEQIGARTN